MKSNLVNLNALIKYLDKQNWVLNQAFPNKKLLVFNKQIDSNEPITIILPAEEHFQDYAQRAYSAIETLSIVEGRSREDVEKEINAPDFDKLEIRVVSSLSEEGSIPLNYATNLFKGLKNLIVSAAYAEEKPSKAFKRPSQRALSFGDKFKLGQTAVGSYIVVVESSSLTNDDLEMFIENDEAKMESYSRRIMKRIHRSMYQIKNFNNENHRLSDIIETGYSTGLNANICEALLSMYQEGTPVTLESKINYSSILVNDDNLPDIIVLENDDYHVIRTIAEALREEESEIMEIDGTISRLSILTGTSFYGSISVSFLYGSKKHTVRVELGEEDYKKACDAHKFNKKVRVIGEMDMSRKTWEVIALGQFEVLDH